MRPSGAEEWCGGDGPGTFFRICRRYRLPGGTPSARRCLEARPLSIVDCRTCGQTWDATLVVCCPGCLASRWLATERLVRAKHDPRAQVEPHAEYRSVVTERLLADLPAVLAFAAARGAWFLDTGYEMLVHMTPEPLGRAPGAGIPAGQREPEHALDCLFIAEADSAEEAHVFAVDGARHAAQVRAGLFVPLGACGEPGCANLALPRHDRCIPHAGDGLSRWPAP